MGGPTEDRPRRRARGNPTRRAFARRIVALDGALPRRARDTAQGRVNAAVPFRGFALRVSSEGSAQSWLAACAKCPLRKTPLSRAATLREAPKNPARKFPCRARAVV